MNINDADADRLNSKFRNATVVDLNAYRAAAASRAHTASAYLDPTKVRWIAIAIIVLAVLGVVARA